ncbi:hypothetical protein SAMN05443429_102190 [Cruoricaptor ignavus]|uniref:Uncharacterized protein n=1 Tax=Cruoricaptor ignavus TaxID=1118202 RepID=A0A1M6C1N4_9FLAO|nr:hypothetical protein [Cruoricaptor ignavus]SHI54741.1 hypothetical protein SAMN05443429_102190 [Cruoricaptor ignavus]
MNLEDLLPYAAALIIAAPFLIYFRQFLKDFVRLKEQELRLLGAGVSSQSRAVAYEKMTIFLDRLRPSNLVQNFSADLKPHEFIYLSEKSINEEFSYNAPQQLYLSKKLWKEITFVKNEIINLSHKTYEGLGENATLDDFKTIFLMNYATEGDFVGETMDSLKREALYFAKQSNNL